MLFRQVMVSSTAAIGGSGAIAYGNAIGSIICNTALICAITIAVAPAVCERKSLYVPFGFFFGSAILYALVAIFFRSFSRLFGFLLLAIFAVYMFVVIKTMKREPKPDLEEQETKTSPLWKDLLFLILGAGFIAVGANWLVFYGKQIATMLGVPESVIALTFVALGTSLPELVTAITSLVKKHGSLSLGNIIGANLFNIVLVCGMSISICPFDLPASKTIAGYNASLLVDIPVMFAVMLIMALPPLLKGKMKRWQVISLLIIYAAFCTFQFAF